MIRASKLKSAEPQASSSLKETNPISPSYNEANPLVPWCRLSLYKFLAWKFFDKQKFNFISWIIWWHKFYSTLKFKSTSFWFNFLKSKEKIKLLQSLFCVSILQFSQLSEIKMARELHKKIQSFRLTFSKNSRCFS